MIKIEVKANGNTIETGRIIGQIQSDEPGPCLVFFAGIHGNEPSGIVALQEVFHTIKSKNIPLKGSVLAIAGNLWALERGERFEVNDLNRLWTPERMSSLREGVFKSENKDDLQQSEIYTILQDVLKTKKGPFYFFDLHTTSGDTIPFITVNDSLLNRTFTKQYPVPLILGIEEHLDGPLLSYINELGYVSFGFEGGQHDSHDAIDNHRIFAFLSLVFAGSISKEAVPFQEYLNHWKAINPNHQAFYEIYDRYEIQSDEDFRMEPGFQNFQSVTKGIKLAVSNNKPIKSKKNITLFMPLYQAKGNDGYFLIKRTPRFFLWLSGVVRRLKMDRVFPLLPGVRWSSKDKDTMLVDLRIAKLITKQLFHLFGYRSKQIDQSHLRIKNREARSRTTDYKQSDWM